MGKAHDPNSERGRGRRDHPGREVKKKSGEQYLSQAELDERANNQFNREEKRPPYKKFRIKKRWEERVVEESKPDIER